MGVRDPKTGRTTSATMLADVYSSTADPDVATPAAAPFGQIDRYGTVLDPALVFSKIVPPATPPNLFQGDVVELDLSGSSAAISQHRYAMVISHSCDIGQGLTTVVCPVYRDSELTDSVVNAFWAKPAKDPHAIQQRKDALLRNKAIRLAAFPGVPVLFASPIDEPFVVAFPLSTAMKMTMVAGAPLVLRLSYRGLAFLQWRLGTLYQRDVQDSDETRDY
jgi:hypothetical protein